MRNPSQTRLTLVVLLIILIAGCRRGTQEPTPTVKPTEPATTEAPAQPSSTPVAAAPPATPAAEAEPDEDLLQMDPDAIDWAPELLYRSPAPGEETPLDGAITIRFDQPMAQETVEEAFTIRPADSVGDEEVEGAFEWPRPDTLIFTPRARLERQARYRVQIGESAAARNGRTLTGPLELYFDTAGFLEVARIIPEDGVGGVSSQVSVTVLFNRPVVPLVTTGQQADLPQPLEFDPPVEGSGEWLSTSIYTFIPEEGFAGATEYQVTVPAGLTDVVGGVLAEDVTSTFTTATPSVANIVLEPSATEVRPDRPITVTFNMAMDPASTESAISLDPQAPVTFEWSEENRVLSLVPEDLLALDTRYTLLIDDTARSANRAAMLDRETSTRFTTVPFPAVVSTDPGPGETAPFYQHGINIRFASPMDPATIRDRIQISPQPEEEVHYFIFEANVNLAFPLERDTDYTITIPGDVADPYGNTLGEAYTWQFRTPPPPPVASINLPAPVGQFSTVHPTTVGIIARNVETVNAALYRVGLQPRLLIEPYQLDDAPALANAEQIASWQLTPDLQGNEAEVVSLDLAGAGQTLPLGIYNLRVSGPGIGDDVRWWQNQNSLIVVADTNLVVKQTFEAVHVWATDLATGEPVADLPLTLYNRNGIASGTATTDASGLATFPYSPEEAYLSAVLVVAREPGQPGFGAASSQWNEGISPWQFGVDNTSAPPQPQFAYIYTDRPIYRPGDTVYFRGILRDANYARYGLPQEGEVTVEVEFTSYYEPADSESVALTLPVDANGTFNGAYQIPEGAQLGQYRLHLQDEQNIADAFRHFTVAEYRRPEFQVSVTPEQDEALRGETVDVIIEADYFFGAPAADLSVHWIIRERNYQLPWDGPFYSFDDDDNFYFAYGHDANFFGNFLREGTATTDADGRVVLTLPADLLAEVEDGSRVVTVEATVRDVSEFPISGTGEVVLHAAESYVGIAPEEYLNQAGTETTVNLITVNADAEPLPSQEVEVVFYERDYRFVEQTNPNGTSFGEWVADDTEVARTTATTGSNGRAEATFVPEAGGTYRAAATVTDANGRTHTSSVLFWVAGRDFVGWRVNPEEKRMDLTLDQRTYEVGDRARILVQSPFVGPVNAWLTIERGEVIEQRLITLQTNSDVVEIPVTEALSPNAYVTIVAMKGVDATNPFADLRVGLTELVVPPTPFTLDVELVPRDEFLSPGETVTYDIRVTDSNGQPVQADLSLALVDLAVLTLAPDNAPDIVDAFYAREAYRSTLGSGLIFSGEGLEAAIPEQDAGLGGGGGAEAVAMDAGRALAEEDSSVRRDFPDTAFWRASLITDANGQATAEIPLPDTLTTWRLSSKAVTADSQVGQKNVDIISTLPLLVRPVTPRFFTAGDLVDLGAVVNNNTDQALEVAVSLEATGVALVSDDAEQTVRVPAGGQQLVRWTVRVEDVEAVDLTFRASGGDFSDATKPTVGDDGLIPVYRYDAEDLTGTSGVLDEAGVQAEAVLLPDYVNPRSGSIDVRLTPSLAGAVLEALEYVDYDPIEIACAHGAASQLLTNVVTAQAFRSLNVADAATANEADALVNAAIARLDALEKTQGGWGWCDTRPVDEYLTAYALHALALARDAGYDLAGLNIPGALNYLEAPPEWIGEPFGANRQAWFLFVRAEWNDVDVEELDTLFTEDRELLDPYAKAYLALAYEMAGADGDNNQRALLSDLSGSAVASATGTHWEDASRDWRNLASDIRSTAVVLDALARLDQDNPLAPGAARWLMNARTASHWATPFETAWVVQALTDWMVATGELEADFDYQFNVNGTQLAADHFDRTAATAVETFSVPIPRLPADEVNYLIFQRGEGPGRLYYTAHLDAFVMAEAVQPVSRGVTVERLYYDGECDPEGDTACQPLTQIEAGQRVRVELTIIAPDDLLYLRVEDPIPAGAEAVDPGLATTASGLGGDVVEVDRDDRDEWYGYWGWWRFNHIEYRDDRVLFLSDFLPAGTYQYSYYLETPIPGEYQVRPAVAYQEFFPEVFGRSAGMLFIIEE